MDGSSPRARGPLRRLTLALVLLCFGPGCHDLDAFKRGSLTVAATGDGDGDGDGGVDADVNAGDAAEPGDATADAGAPADAGDEPDAQPAGGGALDAAPDASPGAGMDATVDANNGIDPSSCDRGQCWWSGETAERCSSAGHPDIDGRPDNTDDAELAPLYLATARLRLGNFLPDGSMDAAAWQRFGFDLDGVCTNSSTCATQVDAVSCRTNSPAIPFDGDDCRDNAFARWQQVAANVPQVGGTFGLEEAVFNCALWRGSYSVVAKLSGYNGQLDDDAVRLDFYTSIGIEDPTPWECPQEDFDELYPRWRASDRWLIDQADVTGPVEKPGELPASRTASQEAFVRDGYVVALLPPDFVYRLAGDRADFPGFALPLERGLWTGRIERRQDGTFSLYDGLLGGIVRKQALLDAFRQVGLCPVGALQEFYAALEEYIEEAADIRADGVVDATADCDALSVGIMFEAHSATPGALAQVSELIDCPPPPRDPTPPTSPTCGNGSLDTGELCDIAIAQGEAGACPDECPRTSSCGFRELVGQACSAHCVPLEVGCNHGDGCCPLDCNAASDDDCSPTCGDGLVQASVGETCEPGTATPCLSPQDCDDGQSCTQDIFSGSVANCNTACENRNIVEPADGDRCCPPGANANIDADCVPRCGNSVVEGDEECDGSAGCDDNCALLPTTDQQHCLDNFATDSCRRCACIECTAATLACLDSGDATADMHCAAVESCGRSNGCSGNTCYCGTSSLCLTPNGPCREPIEAAAGTTDPLAVSNASQEPGHPLYLANQVSACLVERCAMDCL